MARNIRGNNVSKTRKQQIKQRTTTEKHKIYVKPKI